MVHHFCIMRPIRSLLGLILLTAAVVCFYRAMERSRSGVIWQTERSERQSYTSARSKRTVVRKAPANDRSPIPNPPQPSSNGEAAPPDWLGQAPHLESRDGIEVYVATATSGRYSTPEECDRALVAEIDRIVDDFAEKQFQPVPDRPVKLDRDDVEEHLIQGRYRATVNSSVGPMQEESVLLVFDRPVRAAIERQWRSVMAAERLRYAAAGSGALFLALGGVYLILKWKPSAR
jgi:hypothetical protein